MVHEQAVARDAPAVGALVRHAAGPDAAAAIVDMLRRCSVDTLFHRMLGLSRDAADQLVAPVRHGSPAGRVDLVAQRGCVVVGWGCLVPENGVWEVALVVEDSWQGRGVGDQLARALLARAADSGVLPVRAVTAPGNRRVASLIGRCAEIVRPPTTTSDDIEYWLAPQERGRDT